MMSLHRCFTQSVVASKSRFQSATRRSYSVFSALTIEQPLNNTNDEHTDFSAGTQHAKANICHALDNFTSINPSIFRGFSVVSNKLIELNHNFLTFGSFWLHSTISSRREDVTAVTDCSNVLKTISSVQEEHSDGIWMISTLKRRKKKMNKHKLKKRRKKLRLKSKK
uniref:Ribosomal protein mS38 C-terminal domain-containing protein n=1 Tax=Proboscia inermis TaxID=420281 RepID=A0A7S0GKK1_9STRA|mmetsp:Transcript_4547/g.4685  ORF Transcript_4547/g.4685 Transcript_4547/m.4685 type:complete len:167 (+) Transcript_4547:29-529(+)